MAGRKSCYSDVSRVLLACMDGNMKEAELSFRRLNVNIDSCARVNPLLFACAMGNYDMAKFLLDSGANVHTKAGSLLIEAIVSPADEETKCKFVELLLSKGADIDRTNQRGRTALQAAAYYNWTEVAKLLIQKGARIVNPESGRPVFAFELGNICGQGYISMLELLLEALPKRIGANDNWVFFALLAAVTHDWNSDEMKRMIKMFVDKGVDINVKDEEGNTLLHAACGHDSIYGELHFNAELAAFLLDNSADVNAFNEDGRTALHVLCAVEFDDDSDESEEESEDGGNKTEDELEEESEDGQGAEEENEDGGNKTEDEIEDGKDGEDKYVKYESQEVEDEGEENDSNQNEKQKLLDCVKILLQYGADVDVFDDEECSPLELAVQSGNSEVVDLLLAHKKPTLPKHF